MADLGRAALYVSLALALYASLAGTFAARTRRRRLADSAGNALLASFGATAVASAVLLSALVRHDFSFVYVAQHTSTELPTGYSMSAFWGGQEGSLLLWLLVLGASAAPLPRLRRADGAVRVCDGRAARGAHRRALDRRDAPLDARRVDGARRRPAARRALG